MGGFVVTIIKQRNEFSVSLKKIKFVLYLTIFSLKKVVNLNIMNISIKKNHHVVYPPFLFYI